MGKHSEDKENNTLGIIIFIIIVAVIIGGIIYIKNSDLNILTSGTDDNISARSNEVKSSTKKDIKNTVLTAENYEKVTDDMGEYLDEDDAIYAIYAILKNSFKYAEEVRNIKCS